MLSANGTQHIRCFIAQALFYSLMLLKMGITIARTMSSQIWNVNKLLTVASNWLFSLLYILMTHGKSTIRFPGRGYKTDRINQKARHHRSQNEALTISIQRNSLLAENKQINFEILYSLIFNICSLYGRKLLKASRRHTFRSRNCWIKHVTLKQNLFKRALNGWRK
jgi:hypothetical protein